MKSSGFVSILSRNHVTERCIDGETPQSSISFVTLKFLRSYFNCLKRTKLTLFLEILSEFATYRAEIHGSFWEVTMSGSPVKK